MKKKLLSLAIALTLLIAPLAHAAGISVENGHCQASESHRDASDEFPQDHAKIVKAGHCCCVYASANADITLAAPQSAFGQMIFYSKDLPMYSFVQGPPLKPPSHV